MATQTLIPPRLALFNFNFDEGVTMQDYRRCRRRIVGWDLNPPEAFPGFGGTVGLGQDCAQLANGDWLLTFHAGYWHLSMATPFIVPEQTKAAWSQSGFRDIDAPQGGRVMGIRSKDKGLTWSRPFTILNGRWDESPTAIKKLIDGSVLIAVNNQASWYGLDKAPPGHLPMNTRSGFIRSEDNGQTWSDPFWLESPYPIYQRAYAQPIELGDGSLLYPTYCNAGGHPLHGAIHRSQDGGRTWQLLTTITRQDGKDIDEPSIVKLADGRLMLITRLDAALFYSEDRGRTWSFSHCAPFAPLKPSRLATLVDGTVICWMTSSGKLRASWSTDNGLNWHVDTEGKPFALDPDHYGYPGGFLMDDQSVFVVYYDAANLQQRTSVWGIRFRIDDKRENLQILPAPGLEEQAKDRSDGLREHELDVDAM